MKLLGLSFDDDANPEVVTVAMTGDEALFLAAFIGGTNDTDRETVMRGAGRIGSDIYDCLVDNVFNRYYDDGVSEALQSRLAREVGQ